jgi:hypothetical protein
MSTAEQIDPHEAAVDLWNSWVSAGRARPDLARGAAAIGENLQAAQHPRAAEWFALAKECAEGDTDVEAPGPRGDARRLIIGGTLAAGAMGTFVAMTAWPVAEAMSHHGNAVLAYRLSLVSHEARSALTFGMLAAWWLVCFVIGGLLLAMHGLAERKSPAASAIGSGMMVVYLVALGAACVFLVPR